MTDFFMNTYWIGVIISIILMISMVSVYRMEHNEKPVIRFVIYPFCFLSWQFVFVVISLFLLYLIGLCVIWCVKSILDIL